MPELPEVETIARQLQILVGQRIVQVDVRKAKSWSGDLALVLEQPILSVSRRAKILHIKLANATSLLIHLKMSGQLIYLDGETRLVGGHPTADWVNALPSSHTRVIFSLANGPTLFFNDQRIFGWVRVMDEAQVQQVFAELGPDIIDPVVTTEYLCMCFARKTMPIKQAIMDNAIVSGVGNIYANDALNLVKISPLRPAKSLREIEIEALRAAMVSVINTGIQLGGATVHGKYVQASGLGGQYQTVMRVYNKEGLTCPNCGNLIQKITLGGRGTFFCPSCQV